MDLIFNVFCGLSFDDYYLFGKIPFMTQTDSMTNLTMGAGFFILFT